MGEEYCTLNWAADIGYGELVVQDPSLTIDRETGELYCVYSFADTTQWSAIGMPQADLWACKSFDGGNSWTVGQNISQTDGGQNAPPGQCHDEAYPGTSPFVRYENGVGYLDMLYMLDLDAGNSVLDGSTTENPIIFKRVRTDYLNADPIRDNQWPVLHADSSGIPIPSPVTSNPAHRPREFTLYQNYPNPFNPATTIQFDLARAANAELAVFDLQGRLVKTLLSNQALAAGVHRIEFDGAGLPSGTYFYRLRAGEFAQTKKLLLLK